MSSIRERSKDIIDFARRHANKKGLTLLWNRAVRAVDKLSDKVGDAMDGYDQTMREGDYARQPNLLKRILGLATKKKDRKSFHSKMGQKAAGVGIGLGMKVIIGGIAAALASTTVALSAGVIVIGGGSCLLYKDYRRAKTARNEVIEEWNMSGQRVSGTRGDLCRLRDAHMHLLYPETYCPEGSKVSREKIREKLLATVSGERERVQVLEAGQDGASALVYSLPGNIFDFDYRDPAEFPEGQPKLAGHSLAEGWRSRRTEGVVAATPAPAVIMPQPAKQRFATAVPHLSIAPKPFSAQS